VEEGALLSYSAGEHEMWKPGALYVDKILKGAKPSDLPIEQPTRFKLTINLRTAKALGITIPESILLRADETRDWQAGPTPVLPSARSRASAFPWFAAR